MEPIKKLNFIDYLGFERTVNIQNPPDYITDLQRDTVNFVKEKKFGIDGIYFCDDFPAVFTKQVNSFDNSTLKEIAETHQNIWNFKKVFFLYVYNEVQIRIYNCSEKPFPITKKTNYGNELDKLELSSAKTSDRQNLEYINRIFSSIAIDTGIIWNLEEAHELRKKINLKHRVNEYLVESLIRLTHDLQNDGLNIGLIHKNILRSLFLLYLEDRGATDETFYNKIMEGSKSYFDILDDVDATYALFKKLKMNFNGNVFTFDDNEVKFECKDLKKIKKCFISGYENTEQLEIFENWRLFNFEIIPIELLSEIYENFLLKIDPQKKKLSGTFFTPPSLVELMLNERLPVNSKETDYEVKILDPACGSGIFLVESFKRLIKRYEYKHNEKLTNYDKLQKLLLDNIYGIEYDPLSIKVAAFSLYLALLENVEPKTLWQDRNLPYLINNPEDESIKKQGKNLYRRDTIKKNNEIESIAFDLVIGNPPFGTKELLPTIREYCNKEGFAKEKALPFLHKAVKFSPKGKVALIFNTKTLTNTGSTYAAFRKWLFDECYVEKVYNFSILRKAPKNFGGQLFRSTTVPVSIAFYQKEKPDTPNDKIMYYAPKTFIKNHVLEGIVIDSSDVKYLPREECQKPNTKIWKIAMWGGMSDFTFLNRLNKYGTFRKYLINKKVQKGLGLQFLDKSTKKLIEDDEIPNTYISPQNISRYVSYFFSNLNSGLTEKSKQLYAEHYNTSFDQVPHIDVFRRIGVKSAYKSPHILIKEGLSNWKICSSFIDVDCAFNSKVLGLSYHDDRILKGLTCFLNSKIVYYYLFICSASIGIEREEIKPNEIYQLPFVLSDNKLYELAELYDKYIDKNDFLHSNLEKLENNVDNYILSIYEVTDEELSIINNFIEYSVPLLVKSYNYIFNSVSIIYSKDYSIKICKQLNGFLEGQNLFANATVYSIKRFSPLMMIKISFGNSQKELFQSVEDLNTELKKLDKYLWEKESTNIYFRKKMNYKNGNDIYIIRPNQRRFWTQTMAIEDASELILEILNEV